MDPLPYVFLHRRHRSIGPADDDEASMEALERAIEDTVAATGGDACVAMVRLPDARRVFHDDDDVARLLDEIIPQVSDLDEQDPRQVALVFVRALGVTSWEEAAVLGAAVMRPHPGNGSGGGGDDAYRDGGFGALPASAAAVAELKKAAFRAAAGGYGAAAKGSCGGGVCVTGCAVCLEEFEDGEEVTVMPCEPEHGFHPGCITEWLGCSNVCPLCRHPLPISCGDDR